MRQRLILASASPRRLELLRQIGVEPAAVIPADIDETPLPREVPHGYVRRIAAAKLRVVCEQLAASSSSSSADTPPPPTFVLAADSIVAVGRRILGKPADAVEAAKFWRLYSGRRHRVYTGVALANPAGKMVVKVAITQVQFKSLSAAEIARFVASNEWQGKAGGYAIQGMAEAFVQSVSGSISNIIGLPLCLTRNLLLGNGWIEG
ncbi:MAG: septum formation protein Maf [Alphaproteobacteria bacterium]|nr:septum formation protein Maf [Alphaproteobacteria bacterium]